VTAAGQSGTFRCPGSAEVNHGRRPPAPAEAQQLAGARGLETWSPTRWSSTSSPTSAMGRGVFNRNSSAASEGNQPAHAHREPCAAWNATASSTATVYNVMPPNVTYALHPMGSTLLQATAPLIDWSVAAPTGDRRRPRPAYDARTPIARSKLIAGTANLRAACPWTRRRLGVGSLEPARRPASFRGSRRRRDPGKR